MARYTCLFTVANSGDCLQSDLMDVLETCNFAIVYHSGDYLMAREKPGGVNYAQLVTVEVIIDKPTDGDQLKAKLNLVIKNEELPLQLNNHCRVMFDLLNEKIKTNDSWQLVEHVQG